MDNRDEIEFDLIQLMRFLLKKVWIILLVVALCGVGGFVASKLFATPEYTTSCRIYVYKDGEVDYNNLVIATQMTNDCELIITGQNVTERVIENLGLKMSPASLSKRITVSSESNTRILDLEYTDTNPERAAAILNEVCDVAAVQIKEITKASVVTIVYEAKVPTSPSSAGPTRTAVLVAVIGAALTIAILVVLFLMDDTIRTEDDVERYLGLSTLGAIPISDELGTSKKTGDNSKTKGAARFIKK